MAEVKQVGGDHYAAAPGGTGHWDLAERFDLGYLEATATKYIRRYPLKGTVADDLEKAISYLQKMDGRGPRRRVPDAALDEYAAANHLTGDQRYLTMLVLSDVAGPNTIAMAIDHMRGVARAQRTLNKQAARGAEDPY